MIERLGLCKATPLVWTEDTRFTALHVLIALYKSRLSNTLQQPATEHHITLLLAAHFPYLTIPTSGELRQITADYL